MSIKSLEKSRLYQFDEIQLQNLRRIAVVGDLHGDYDALSSLLRLVDLIKDSIIFLGDYADRGKKGIEVIDTIISLMKYPNVVALKGNHEDYSNSGNPQFYPCNLIEEVERKEGSWQEYFQKKLNPFIESLHLAAIIPGETLFVHGGVSNKIRSLDDLRNPTREVEVDVLWSDPTEASGEYPNSERGIGVLFGKDVSLKVCNSLGVKRIIRSHDPRKAFKGPFYEHNGRIITINSTNVYGGKPFILFIDPKNPLEIIPRFI